MRHRLLLSLLLLPLLGCSETAWQQTGVDVLRQLGNPAAGAPLTADEIDAGLREALRVGSERVVAQVGRSDGFNADPRIRIPLPKKLAEARDFARKLGLDARFNEVEIRLNRAAEAAAPQARTLFARAIREMTLADARAILDGPADAATRYFAGRMTPELTRLMRPVVERSLDEVGALRSYRQALQKYQALPLAPRVELDLTGYVTEQGIAGIFHYLAAEEAAIRHDPLKRTTALLQRVFGQAP